MFEQYFDFKENPFKLAPDSSYLFLGRHHEEAIAHLKYAVLEGEGFIAITGEKGVGKTTVCRSFAGKLDENTKVAYIYKPAIGPGQLLKAINAEFGIPSDKKDVKDLTDSLNTFLMQQKLHWKKVAIFIDDAQSMNRDVLEQVRLISNLETTRDKLLQIILIGEPVLSQMLASRALRQIGQRVSVGYHIDAFTYDETMVYIHHRLTIASNGSPVRFDPKAVRRIYRYSGGVPRSINIVCERALKVAFYRKEKLITGEIAEEAIKYLAGRSEAIPSRMQRRKTVGWIFAGCCLVLAASGIIFFIAHGLVAKPGKEVQTVIPPSITTPRRTTNSKAVTDYDREAEAFIRQKDTPLKADATVASEATAEPQPPFHEETGVQPIHPPELTHSVQVGAFLEEKHAGQLAAMLIKRGYSAEIVPVLDSRKQTWLTVRIGDYPSRETARAEAEAFSARENMQTAVRPYGKF
jgi:general secretion pathway protein A